MELFTEPSTSTARTSETTSSAVETKSYTNPEVVVKEAEEEEEQKEEPSDGTANSADEVVSYSFEGVTAEDFQEFAETVTPAIQGGAASLFVLVWVMFFAAGILAVQTLLRSMERF